MTVESEDAEVTELTIIDDELWQARATLPMSGRSDELILVFPIKL